MWPRPRANRFASFLFALGVTAGVVPAASAAELSVAAPAACLDPSAVADEVGDLIGKPLGSVADVDFRVQISETPRHRWRLRLEMIGQRPNGDGTPAVRGSREIEGATCGELAEAAAVAIAISVRSISPEAGAPPLDRPAPPAASAPTPIVATPAASPPPIRPTPEALPWRPTIALALAVDSGALPNTGLGVDVEATLQRGALRVAALGTWFGSRETVAANGAGGTFQLAIGGALVCFAPRRGRWTGLACGGFELGRLTGTGLRVARPETGVAFWRAARADLGVTATLGSRMALTLRAGASAPFSRPEFVLDGADLVYQPSRLAGRFTAGLEVGF